MTSPDRIAAAADEWARDGWVVVDGLVPAHEVAGALAEITERAEPLPPEVGPTRRADADTDTDVRFRKAQFDGTTLFPYPDAPKLNRLFVHPAMVDFAAQALGTRDLRIYQSRVWSKSGGHTDYEQPLHIDGNHSLLPIRQGPGWGHVLCFLYLHDVDDQRGAPRAVPASAAGSNGLGIGDGLGGSGTNEGPVSRIDAPELYSAEASAVGSAGSLFAYRSDVWHRGVDLPVGSERHVLVVGFRPARVEWIGFDAHEPLVNRPDFVTFAEQCTPDELALFGVPRPGHEFWTVDVLDAMARIYPGLDLTPWYAAL